MIDMEMNLKKIEDYLKQAMINSDSKYSQKVYDAMSYSLMAGGKRIRPHIAMLFSELLCGDASKAIPFACGVEMIHTYSLIHDDLPCMDNDDMRRGKPSNHMIYGEDIALLAGDGLLTRAFEICLEPKAVELVGAEKAVKAAYVLSKYSGVYGMVGGQCIDLMSDPENPNRDSHEFTTDELKDMVMGKTVGLIKAAALMGAVIGGADEAQLKAVETYAEGVGMAFQIRDDILDVIGDPELLGKATGIDQQNGRRNFVTFYGLEKADQLVKSYTKSAVEALACFNGDTSELVGLANKMVTRVN